MNRSVNTARSLTRRVLKSVPEKELDCRVIEMPLIPAIKSCDANGHHTGEDQKYRYNNGQQGRVDNKQYSRNDQYNSGNHISLLRLTGEYILIWVLDPGNSTRA
jgi:hypothetical protein